jgi:hypothetical protein
LASPLSVASAEAASAAGNQFPLDARQLAATAWQAIASVALQT